MNIGVLLDSIGNSQEAFLSIVYGNKINQNQIDNQIILFLKDISLPCLKFFGTVAALEKVHHSDCHVIATNIDLAKYAINVFNTKKKILYLHEIEWLHGNQNYMNNCNILRNEKLDIVVPSKEYDDELFNYCGKRAIKIIEDFNLERIISEVCTDKC